MRMRHQRGSKAEDFGRSLHRHCAAMEQRRQGRDPGLSSARLVWCFLYWPRRPRRRAQEQGHQSRDRRTFGLEVDAFEHRQISRLRQGGPLVLVGHSQGANNVIDMARLLERENIPVDLLVTLAPMSRTRSRAMWCGPSITTILQAGARRLPPMPVIAASCRTSISAAT